jgi:hypothetical protein
MQEGIRIQKDDKLANKNLGRVEQQQKKAKQDTPNFLKTLPTMPLLTASWTTVLLRQKSTNLTMTVMMRQTIRQELNCWKCSKKLLGLYNILDRYESRGIVIKT